MPNATRTVKVFQCTRCDHEWIPRGTKEPKNCPACKSPYWNTPRMNPDSNQPLAKKRSKSKKRRTT